MNRGAAPGERRGGRAPGTPNKMTADLREMIAGALADAGGRAYLLEQARQNPGPFLALVGRCLPKEVRAELSATVRQEVRCELIDQLVDLINGRESSRVALPTPVRPRH